MKVARFVLKIVAVLMVACAAVAHLCASLRDDD